MLNQGKLAGKEKVQFSLRLWMDEETPAIDSVMNATWQGKITVTASYIPKRDTNEKLLYNIVEKQASLDNIASEFVENETGIDFGLEASDTNGKGVYTVASTKDYYYPVHYFRGEVANNNVKFANFCWKMVRTTETGGVKLIYNGIPNETGGCTSTEEAALIGTSAFNEQGDSDDYVGYMYPESTNENSSTIKTVIDTWYQNNMVDYTNMLEDTIWCNDRSIYDDSNQIFYGATKRNYESPYNPSIVCPNANDKFTVSSKNGNGKLTYPVALLTADEVTLAGSGLESYEDYLGIEKQWWILSPYMVDNTDVFEFYVGNRMFADFVVNTYGVRPSISLAPGTTVTDFGDGSQNNPYEIVLNNK